ncbi:MAG: nucleotidyltransferase [Bacteroidales bacterium]
MLIERPDVTAINEVLEKIVQNLEITDSQFETAVKRYEAVGNYLNKPKSRIYEYAPEIYPQGSFLLGTVIKPVTDEDEYDVDLVCQLTADNSTFTQESLKLIVGKTLKDSEIYRSMLQPEKRRCWTLDYAESTKFHMDILPSIPDDYQRLLASNIPEGIAKNAIGITDNETEDYKQYSNDWPKSNPKGYATWFKEQMLIQLTERRKTFAKAMNEGVESVPGYKIKTPLQRAIQIMKRHRDIMFGDDDDKPISIIITTLSARAYSNEDNLFDALMNILNRMPTFIEERIDDKTGRKTKWVENPVDPRENFADKWVENDQKEKNFFMWMKKIKSDFDFIKAKQPERSYELLKAALGTRAVNEAYREVGFEKVISESSILPASILASLLYVSHREEPSWSMKLTNYVEIHGRYRDNGAWNSITNQVIVPKNCDIFFNAITNVKKPFDVYWQIVNTGEEALHNLRGNIFKAFTLGAGGLKHKESTLYKGTHWAECFIIKNNECVARSKEFFVNIA